jgi:uncharacterized membrane protein (Fun14 family)
LNGGTGLSSWNRRDSRVRSRVLRQKLLKVLAAAAGIFILALAYLDYKGVIHVNTQARIDPADQTITKIVAAGVGSNLLSQTVSAVPLVGSFVVGAVIG